MALKRVNFATAHNASQFTSARWNFQPVPDGFGNAPIQLVEIAPGNPRFAYNPATGEPQGILIEEQRTNFFTNSQNPLNIIQNIDGGTIELISGDSTRRGGQVVGFRSELGSTAVKNFRIATTGIQVGDITTYQLEVKKPEGSIITGIYLSPASMAGGWLSIDLSNNTISSVTAGDNNLRNPFIKDLGDGYLLVGFTCDITVSDTPLRVYVLSGTTTYEGTGDVDLIFGTPQVERGNNATSYIPTNGTAVTRTADVVARTLGAEFNPSEGTFVVELELPNDNTTTPTGGGIFYIGTNSGSSTSGSISLIASTSAVGRYLLRYGGGGSAFAEVLNAFGKTVKAAVKYDQNFAYISINGSAAVSVARAADPSLFTRFTLGSINGTNYLNGTVSLLKYEPHAVSDARLQELSRL